MPSQSPTRQRRTTVTSATTERRSRKLNHVSLEQTAQLTRQERKKRTRQAILDAAWRLVEQRSFAGVSLREVAKEAGIVPTAFYRHFASMDELGISLVEESMRSMRAMVRDARKTMTEDAIRSSVAALYHAVRGNEAPFRFLSRERYGGVGPVRAAIATELRLFVSELAIDLGRVEGMAAWSSEDLRMAADLIVTAMLGVVMNLVDARSTDEDEELLDTARKQLRLVFIGARSWRSTSPRS